MSLMIRPIYLAFHGHEEFSELSREERVRCMKRGAEIHRSSQERNFRDQQHDKSVSGCWIHQQGELGSCAVAKRLDLPWTNSMDTFRGPDLPHNIEARTMSHDHYGCKVREEDDDSKRVVLCIVERGKEHLPYRIPGWINAKFGKKPQWLIDPNDLGCPMYAVPQEYLYPLSLLRKLISHDLESRITSQSL